MRKIRQIKQRAQTSNRARRTVVRELCSGTFDQIVFAARRIGTLEWVTCVDADDAETFYACELIKAGPRAEILAEHLNRVEEEDDGA